MRVVLVRLSALGDIIHTWPLAQALREAKPDIHLSWVVEEPFRPLVDNHPAVDCVFTVASRRWRRQPWSAQTKGETALVRSSFHELQPDIALDPQGVFKSAIVTRWTKATRRVGLARPWRRELMAGIGYTETLRGPDIGNHVISTNLEFVRALGQKPPTITPPDGSWLLEKMRPRLPTGPWNSPYAVILPGAGMADKILPEDTLVTLGRSLRDRRFDVVVAWGPGEHSRAAAIAESGGNDIHLAPSTDLGQLTALIGEAALVVGGDTGPVHLAASLGVPTMAVFLSTDWRRNGPLGARTAVVSGAAEASGGSSGSAKTKAHRKISADEIEIAILELLRI